MKTLLNILDLLKFKYEIVIDKIDNNYISIEFNQFNIYIILISKYIQY